MQNFEDIWNEYIITPLKNITLANGYENDLCWLDGWLVYYAEDLARGYKGLFWPAIAARAGREEITMQRRASKFDAYQSQNVRSFIIEVGVDGIQSRETLNQRLESVLRDIKKAVSTANTGNLTLTSVTFNIPEETLDYAFLVVNGTITYNETWGN